MNRPVRSGPERKRVALSAPRTMLGSLLAAGSAAILTLAFPPFNLGSLVWVGFVPMSVAQHRVLPERISSLAPAIAIGGWLGALLVPTFGGKSWLMTLLPLVIFVLVLGTDKKKRAFHEGTTYRYAEELRSLAAQTNTYLVIGYVVDDESGFRNEATVLSPSGEFLGVYGKVHPMVTSGEPKTVSAGVCPVYTTSLGQLGTLI